MNYEALKTELLKPEYQGLSDNEAADKLNAMTETAIKSRFVTARTILFELGPEMGSAILDKMEAIATQVSAVKWAMKFICSETGLDIGAPATQAQIDMLVAGGALTAAEGKALKDMAIQPISRAEILGFESMSYNTINEARAN